MPTAQQEGAARGSRVPARHRADQPVAEEALTTSEQPGETLVADARAGLTPAQQVDRKLLALLGTGHPGLFAQAAGNPQNLRGMRERKGPRPLASYS